MREHGIVRIIKFAMATGVGFLFNEMILVVGILAVYRMFTVPSFASSSLIILGLDAVALGTGDTVAFLINERVTVRGRTDEEGRGEQSWRARFVEYQLAALMGNFMIAGVQLTLLATVALSPILGAVVGALVSYPVTYAVSMRLVWRVHPFEE